MISGSSRQTNTDRQRQTDADGEIVFVQTWQRAGDWLPLPICSETERFHFEKGPFSSTVTETYGQGSHYLLHLSAARPATSALLPPRA